MTAIQDIFMQDEKGSFSFEQISAPEFSNHFIKVTEHTKPDIPKIVSILDSIYYRTRKIHDRIYFRFLKIGQK